MKKGEQMSLEQRQHLRETNASVTGQFVCSICGRDCGTPGGLTTHLHVHDGSLKGMNKGCVRSLESKRKNREKHLGRPNPHTEEQDRKIGDALRGRPKSKEYKLRKQARWRDPKFARKMFESWSKRPTSLECRLGALLEELRLPYEYTGDGQLWIGVGCPDFTNVNSQKKLIEAYGCYWHCCPTCARRVSEKRLARDGEVLEGYARFGWETLVIWEHEFDDIEAVKQRLLEFEYGHSSS